MAKIKKNLNKNIKIKINNNKNSNDNFGTLPNYKLKKKLECLHPSLSIPLPPPVNLA